MIIDSLTPPLTVANFSTGHVHFPLRQRPPDPRRGDRLNHPAFRQVLEALSDARDPSDNASPSGHASLVHALVTAHALTGEGRYRDVAEAGLATVVPLMEQAPRFAGHSLTAAWAMRSGPLEVAVVGPAGEERQRLADAARTLPGAVVVVAEGPTDAIPLLSGRTPVDGRPAAYVCRGFVCERPVTTPEELVAGSPGPVGG